MTKNDSVPSQYELKVHITESTQEEEVADTEIFTMQEEEESIKEEVQLAQQ